MNSGLKRIVASRGRMIHRSKNLARRVVVLPSGAELFLGMDVSKEKGSTFNAGINAVKRDRLYADHASLRDHKRRAWH